MGHAFTIPLTIAFGLVLVLTQPVATSAQEVGTAAAVNPSAQARGQSGSRTIIIGQSISHRERIQTTSAGSVQLLFIDKTSMTIGPNSDLAIDEYVFDPQSNTGKLSATLAKGVMRFVGGQVSHTGSAQIATPNGSGRHPRRRRYHRHPPGVHRFRPGHRDVRLIERDA